MRPDREIKADIAPPQADRPSGAQRVLVVDDSVAERRLLAILLRRAGYDVLAVGDGEAALELLREHEPQIVICDWMMPGLSGPDFCAAVRAQEREAYIYILILTSIQDKGAIAHALDEGADDFLSKPFDATELRARVRSGARVVEMQAERVEQNHRLTGALDEIRTLYDAIGRDLDQARQLQHALLPERVCDYGAATAGFLLRSAGSVGGDLVGTFPVGPDKAGFFSLDVSGHGVTPAFLTARMAGLFSNAAPNQNVAIRRDEKGAIIANAPSEIVSAINKYFLDEIETDLYLTMCIVVLELSTGHVELVQAGHPHPLHRTATDKVVEVGNGGMPVGLLFDAEYETVTMTLNPGDQLLLQSDGFVECPAPDGTMLGEEGLSQMLKEAPRGDPATALNEMVEKLGNFAGSWEFPDDVSGVLIDYVGPSDSASNPK